MKHSGMCRHRWAVMQGLHSRTGMSAGCMKMTPAAFTLPKGQGLRGPSCLSFAHLSSDSFLVLPLLCSALRHRDNAPCSLCFSGSYVSQLPSESGQWRPQEGDGRTEGREGPQCLCSSLFALGDPRSSYVLSVAPALSVSPLSGRSPCWAVPACFSSLHVVLAAGLC